MPFAIRLYPKWGGDAIVLGSQFNTLAEANAYADRDVCRRCNRVEIFPLRDGMVWRDKRAGFVESDALDYRAKVHMLRKTAEQLIDPEGRV